MNTSTTSPFMWEDTKLTNCTRITSNTLYITKRLWSPNHDRFKHQCYQCPSYHNISNFRFFICQMSLGHFRTLLECSNNILNSKRMPLSQSHCKFWAFICKICILDCIKSTSKVICSNCNLILFSWLLITYKGHGYVLGVQMNVDNLWKSAYTKGVYSDM